MVHDYHASRGAGALLRAPKVLSRRPNPLLAFRYDTQIRHVREKTHDKGNYASYRRVRLSHSSSISGHNCVPVESVVIWPTLSPMPSLNTYKKQVSLSKHNQRPHQLFTSHTFESGSVLLPHHISIQDRQQARPYSYGYARGVRFITTTVGCRQQQPVHLDIDDINAYAWLNKAQDGPIGILAISQTPLTSTDDLHKPRDFTVVAEVKDYNARIKGQSVSQHLKNHNARINQALRVLPFSEERAVWYRVLRKLLRHTVQSQEGLTSRPVRLDPKNASNIGLPVPRYEVDQEWSSATLNAYVRRLTAKINDKVKDSLDAEVTDIEATLLKILFEDQNAEDVLDYDAFRRAFWFFARKRQISVTYNLLDRMTSLGVQPDAAIYNELLRVHSREHNLHAFEGAVDDMLSRGIRPNIESIVLLCSLAPSQEDIEFVMRATMRRSPRPSVKSLRRLVRATTEFTLGDFLDQGGSLESHLSALRSTFGSEWLDRTTIRPFADELGQRGQIMRCVDRFYQDFSGFRIRRPPRTWFHVLLLNCKRQNYIDLAIWLIVYAEQTWQIRLADNATRHILFRMAWKKRMHNVLRVVWKYSCYQGDTTFHMRRAIYRSLSASLVPQEKTRNGRWRERTGIVACGSIPALGDDGMAPDAILERERGLFKMPQPQYSFQKALIYALLLDQQWNKTLAEEQSDDWMLTNMIKITPAPTLTDADNQSTLHKLDQTPQTKTDEEAPYDNRSLGEAQERDETNETHETLKLFM